MRKGALFGALLLAGAAAAQDVRLKSSIEILKLADIDDAADSVSGFPRLRDGDTGTLIIAAFDGRHLTVAIKRSKGIDPPADLREVQEIARSIDAIAVDFNALESKRVSTVEMDFSEDILRQGNTFSGSVPLGRILGELAQWKDLPKPIYVVIGGDEGAEARVSGEARPGISVMPMEKASIGDSVEFRLNAAPWGIPGLFILAVVCAGIIVFPYFTIRGSLKERSLPEEVATLDQLKAKRKEQAKIGKATLFFPFIYIFVISPQYLPVNPLKLGLLMMFGPAGAPPLLVLLAAPFLLTAFIAPAVIKHRRRKQLPPQPETLQARTAKRVRTSIAILYLGMLGAVALLMTLILTRRHWSYLVASVPPRVQAFGFIFLFLAIVVCFLLAALRQRGNVGDLLPSGHRLIDPVHDAGRGAGVHVQEVRVVSGLGFTVARTQGGNFQLSEPLTTLMRDAEAKALIAYEVAGVKRRGFVMLPALAPMLTMIIALFFVRIIVQNAPGFSMEAFMIAMFGFMFVSSIALYFGIQPHQWRMEKAALEFAVRHTGRPNDVLRALARQASLDDIKPNKNPGKKRFPVHVTDKFEIVRRFAESEGMSATREDPFALIEREESERDHESEEVLRLFYRRFNAKEVESLLEMLAEDVEWAGREKLQGREAVRSYLERAYTDIDPRYTPVEFRRREGGMDALVDEVDQDLIGRVIRAGPMRHSFTFGGGLITRWDVAPG